MNIEQTVSRYLEPVTDTDAVTVTLSRAAWEELFLSRMKLDFGCDQNPEPVIRMAALLELISRRDRTEKLSLTLKKLDAEELYHAAKRAQGMNEALFLECANHLARALGLIGNGEAE
jgi:hypothetical protein